MSISRVLWREFGRLTEGAVIDINFIKTNPGALDRALRSRNKKPLESTLIRLEADARSAQTHLQGLLQERNTVSENFGKAKFCGDNTSEMSKRMETIKEDIRRASEEAEVAKKEYLDLLASIPNLPSNECPIGPNEDSNMEVRRIGTPRVFGFKARKHHEIGERLGMMDFARSSRIAGSRFVFLFDQIAKLERALAQFMLDIHTKENGYTEVYVPLILGNEAMFGVGQLPKFENDLFKTTIGTYLIPTAEAPLINIHSGEVLNESELPLRYSAYTPCFRSEAGAAGQDTAGMLRQHQFGKVELVGISTPEGEAEEHERMTECAEGILRRLGLPFRTVVLSTGDMGFASSKTYDIEIWLPGQEKYREISSCSRCGSFQSRRMNTRFKRNGGLKKNEFVHTLNGSGVAVGRCLIAVLENYQEEDGEVSIPEALVPYFGGDRIKLRGCKKAS
jgi:seryl-tRNA synthetase